MYVCVFLRLNRQSAFGSIVIILCANFQALRRIIYIYIYILYSGSIFQSHVAWPVASVCEALCCSQLVFSLHLLGLLSIVAGVIISHMLLSYEYYTLYLYFKYENSHSSFFNAFVVVYPHRYVIPNLVLSSRRLEIFITF